MKQKGRPKNYSKAKHRKKTICLNEKASILLNEIQKTRPNFNFSQYISRRIIDDFGSLEGFIKLLKRDIGRNNKEIDLIQEENKKLIFKIKELQDKEIVRELL